MSKKNIKKSPCFYRGIFLCCVLIRLCYYGQQGVIHIFSEDAVSSGWIIEKMVFII